MRFARESVLALTYSLDPLRMVVECPVLAYPATGDRTERVASAWIDQREVEVAEQEEEGDVHQPVVHDERVLKPEGVVAFAVPEKEAGDCEQNSERRGDDRVQLLAGIEAALWSAAAAEPGAVGGVEGGDCACGRRQRAA